MKRKKPGVKRRSPLFATILRLCAEPMDAVSIADRVGLGRNNMLRIMRKMFELGLVHIGAWTEPAFGRPPAVCWKAGQGKNAARPVGKWRGIAYPVRQLQPHTSNKVSCDMVAFSYAIKEMTDKAVSAREIEAATGWAHTTVARFLRHCRRIGLIHIGDWTRNPNGRGPWIRMFQLGNEPDLPKPKSLTRAEVSRRCAIGRKRRARDLRIVHALAANTTHFSEAA